MALTLVATAGGLTSNTYCTQAEALTYHEAHLYASTWTGATSANKDKALAMATRLLDEQINWYGWKSSNNQALAWPRIGIYDKEGVSLASNTIPTFLKNATAELARLLIASDRTVENEMKGFKSINIGKGAVHIIPDRYDRPGVIPPSVWAIIRPFGCVVTQSRSIVRV